MTDDELKSLFEALREDSALAHAKTREDMGAAVAAVREDMGAAIAAVREENAHAHTKTREDMGAALAAVREENAHAHAETRRLFDVAAERTAARFDLLAEGIRNVQEQLERTRTSLDEKIDRSAAETQAMIKFSHRELDRRVSALEEGQRALEETVADLQARLQRVESGTQ